MKTELHKKNQDQQLKPPQIDAAPRHRASRLGKWLLVAGLAASSAGCTRSETRICSAISIVGGTGVGAAGGAIGGAVTESDHGMGPEISSGIGAGVGLVIGIAVAGVCSAIFEPHGGSYMY
ncbi:MAG: hypothetical protein WC350_03115 [Candidatus Micrarchaeia archaeon]|jgi:hypothetical protein